ncbi:hypothetical protein CYG49_02975 [Candidatus Saccharibacteria bacterium]|nr:MAG: hypothetical protein CYG49_02975 [Candidatus Saccharibacteria bacterium]
MRLLKTFIVASLMMLAVTLLPSPAVLAVDCGPGEVETSFKFDGDNCLPADKNNANIEQNAIYVVLLSIVNFLAAGVGLVIVGGVIYGAFLYITANGNAGKSQQGITIIVNAFIGLVLFIFMYAIINYLVPGGLFK